MKTLYRDNKGLHRWLFACGAVLVLFYLFRGNRAAVNFWVYSVTLPLEQFLGRACAALPFSVAELLYVLAAVTAVVLLVLMVRYLIKSRQKGRAAYRCALFVLDLFLTVYAAFSLLWGANYYADDFCDRSGLSPEPVAYEDLVRVTQYFADHLAEASTHIMRDENGLFTADRQEILNYADTVYDCLYDEFPFLDMPDQKPKGIFFSKIMSAMNFTGFYFPFTGESNVNMDSPAMRTSSRTSVASRPSSRATSLRSSPARAVTMQITTMRAGCSATFTSATRCTASTPTRGSRFAIRFPTRSCSICATTAPTGRSTRASRPPSPSRSMIR